MTVIRALIGVLCGCLATGCLSLQEADFAEVVKPAARHDARLRRHTGIPSVAVSPLNGRLWVTFYGGVTPGEDSNSYVPLVTSVDGGKTWKTVCVAEPVKGRRVFDPELWVAPDGRLRWTFTSRECVSVDTDNLKPYSGVDGPVSSDRLLMAELDAEHEPQRLPSLRMVADGVMMCKPIVTRDGAWILPVARWYAEPSACFFASTDGGKTFAFRGGVTHFPKSNRLYDEHTVIEKANGDWLAFIRAKGSPSCLESESRDGGRTWTKAKKARFEHTSSRHFLRKLRSGNLLLVKNGPFDQDTGRTRLMAFLSMDDGVTWRGGLMLDSRGNVSYPDGDQAPDGTIFVVHDHERLKAQEILLDVFTEQDVLAGRVVTPGMSLQNVISTEEICKLDSVRIER